ncbi:hypothetical protein NPX13_g8636 [Xylaria arbuscula]|uniref:Uncharacterized protein n=1 Tax=Xylaria arbuscula TaxID=114810 RepID=A0A9W8N7U0_9PEZI|nr:hypothetical protein NPX13_g8636 [Xylaria arbuscula]
MHTDGLPHFANPTKSSQQKSKAEQKEIPNYQTPGISGTQKTITTGGGGSVESRPITPNYMKPTSASTTRHLETEIERQSRPPPEDLQERSVPSSPSSKPQTHRSKGCHVSLQAQKRTDQEIVNQENGAGFIPTRYCPNDVSEELATQMLCKNGETFHGFVKAEDLQRVEQAITTYPLDRLILSSNPTKVDFSRIGWSETKSVGCVELWAMGESSDQESSHHESSDQGEPSDGSSFVPSTDSEPVTHVKKYKLSHKSPRGYGPIYTTLPPPSFSPKSKHASKRQRGDTKARGTNCDIFQLSAGSKLASAAAPRYPVSIAIPCWGYFASVALTGQTAGKGQDRSLGLDFGSSSSKMTLAHMLRINDQEGVTICRVPVNVDLGHPDRFSKHSPGDKHGNDPDGDVGGDVFRYLKFMCHSVSIACASHVIVGDALIFDNKRHSLVIHAQFVICLADREEFYVLGYIPLHIYVNVVGCWTVFAVEHVCDYAQKNFFLAEPVQANLEFEFSTRKPLLLQLFCFRAKPMDDVVQKTLGIQVRFVHLKVSSIPLLNLLCASCSPRQNWHRLAFLGVGEDADPRDGGAQITGDPSP